MGDVKLVSTSQVLPQHDSPIFYILDTNVLIHDPTAIKNFDEHHVVIPMTVLEELDKLKSGKVAVAADCRQAIREIDNLLGRASPYEVERGVPIQRGKKLKPCGSLSVLMSETPENVRLLPTHLNDNKILNAVAFLKQRHPGRRAVLVTKDINLRLKARGCGIEADDYHSDQLLGDIANLNKGYIEFQHSFWNEVEDVHTEHCNGRTLYHLPRTVINQDVYHNQFLYDKTGFLARVVKVNKYLIVLRHLDLEKLMERETWGLKPRDAYQAMALNLLLDPDVHLVNLTGAAGSGKTILALAAAIEMTVPNKMYRRIIATRSTQGLDEDIGFLPGT